MATAIEFSPDYINLIP